MSGSAPPPADLTPKPGPKYRRILELARGGMGDVHLAVVSGPAGFNKLVVLKLLRPSLASDPAFLQMFLDEARLAARLSHPNIVQTNEVGETGGEYFIAMEYLAGQPLSKLMRRRRDLPLAMTLRIVLDVLAGLEYAHALCDFDGTPLDVVHRDVSPQNVLITYDGQVKIVDFGIAKAIDSSEETRSGMIKGKVAYMSPEQARSEKVDRRADLFAAGVVLWELVTGQRYWGEDADVTIVHKLYESTLPATEHPKLDEGLRRVLARALAPKAEDRYTSAGQFHAELEACFDALGRKVAARDLGKLVAETFAEERIQVRQTIEQQIRAARGESSGGYAGMRAQFDLVTPTGEVAGVKAASSSGPAPRVAPPAASSAPLPGVGGVDTGAGTANTGYGPAPEDRRRRRTLVWAAGAAVLLAGAGLLTYALRRPASSPAAPANVDAVANAAATTGGPAPTAIPASAAGQGAAPAAASITLEVRVSPPGARVTLDGAPLAGPAYHGMQPADGRSHRIHAEAPGYAARDVDVTFDRDAFLDLSLDRAPQGGGGPRPGGKPAGGGGVKIDPNNPYGVP